MQMCMKNNEKKKKNIFCHFRQMEFHCEQQQSALTAEVEGIYLLNSIISNIVIAKNKIR